MAAISNNNKSLGENNIVAELLKNSGEAVKNKIRKLIKIILRINRYLKNGTQP